MSNIILLIICIFVINPVFLEPACKEGENNCYKCNPLTKLCSKCSLEIYTPDKNGGCSASGKCVIGRNYCAECDENDKKCTECESSTFPDENGGCSFIDNCEISYQGVCLKCKSDFLLIGGENDSFKICKSLNSEDFANCQDINYATGLCQTCKEGYFLTQGNSRCSKIQNCYESTFGKCSLCLGGYYLDRKDGQCKTQTGKFVSCRETIDGETCETCDEDSFMSDEGTCNGVNYCAKGIYYLCDKCKDGYYLTADKRACTKEKNCNSGDRLFGLCESCSGKNYIDLDTRKCYSNREDNEFKYCKKVENGVCTSCEYDYKLSGNGVCTMTKDCAEAENGECIQCTEGHFLGLDNRCTITEHCIYSETYYECIECRDGFYYNKNDKTCYKYKEGYENCKATSYDGQYCFLCKNGFYANQTDHICYSNEEENDFYKCSLSDTTGTYCIGCEDGYFIGYGDHKCSKNDGCRKSENVDRCLECDERHCLNLKTGKCGSNEKITDEKEKFYYRCLETNKEGTACAVCLDGFELSEDGFCVDTTHCSVKENGVCIKCKNNRSYSSCLNSDFGCVPTSYMKCIECNYALDFDVCTKCPQFYKINEKGECIDIDDEDE